MRGSLGHHDHAGGELADLTQHAALLGAGVLEDGVQRCDDRHAQIAQQPNDVAAGRTAEDAVFVLKADDIRVSEIEEIGRTQVGVDLLLLDFEPNFRRVVVTLGNVVDRHDETIRTGILGGNRRAEVVGEGRYAASSRQVIADECDLLDLAVPFHHGSENQSASCCLAGPRGYIGRAVAWRRPARCPSPFARRSIRTPA